MQTPLYKYLKSNGTSFYAFPGAAEDISSSYQNDNYKTYFSKYALLNFPVQSLVDLGGTQSSNIQLNFGSFSSINQILPDNFSDQIIESLRNYVANQEIVIRESRLNNTEYYYDPTALETTSEKIFFKWCKEIGILSLEPALPQDEYFDNLVEFERRNLNDDSYFQEYLWKEREETEFSIISFDAPSSNLELTINGVSNFREGDVIEVDGIVDSSLSTEVYGGINWLGPIQVRVVSVSLDVDDNHVIEIDFASTVNTTPQTEAVAKIVYNRLIQYLGEINGVSNVNLANKSYTEVYAHVPDHTGRTPDVLFRTIADPNYKPGLVFPIIPNQYQPEIFGSELFSSPIVSNPANYPGSYFGQFDTEDFTYELANGDSLRRSGDYFGVSGDINEPVVNGSAIDGITIDFNTSHYVKMNIEDRSISTFDQFNALEVNNAPPEDFEFNAILWYYVVEDLNGNRRSNLYGISFLDHPNNNPIEEESGLRFPPYKKLVTNGSQDGTSYAFALNMNYNIINDNAVEAYNPEAVNSIFSMNLYNGAMKKLGSTNDSFLNIISEHSALKDEIQKVKQLLYSQADFNVINSRISNLDSLLRLYSTNQTISSDTIEVETVVESSPPTIRYNDIDRGYKTIDIYKTTEMYTANGIIPIEYNVPRYKDFLVQIINNDEVDISLIDDSLKISFTSDLEYKQSVDILISGSDLSSQNKKLGIYLKTINPLGTSSTEGIDVPNNDPSLSTAVQSDLTPIETLLIGDIDLPVFYNLNTSQANSAKTWKEFSFEIDFNQSITMLSNNTLEISLDENPFIVSNSIHQGDSFILNNLFIGTTSVFDFSGQYVVSSVGTSSNITIDISTNDEFVSYGAGSLPLTIHSSTYSILSNNPYFSLNKGQWIRVTRISQLNEIPISEKYLIDIRNLEY